MRRLVLVGILILAPFWLTTPPLRAQAACSDAHCLFFPLVTYPPPVRFERSEQSFYMVGVVPVGVIYGVFTNQIATPICDVTIDYQIDNPTVLDQSGSRTITVVMPDEEEWRFLDNQKEQDYTVRAVVRNWRADGCLYTRLTPIDQMVTQLSFSAMAVTGTVRNDSGNTVRGLRVRLMPGQNYTHHYDLNIPNVVLTPGMTATYSTTMSIWYMPVNSYAVSAIGADDVVRTSAPRELSHE